MTDIHTAFPNIRDLRFEISGAKHADSDYLKKVLNLANLKKLRSLDIDLQFKEASPLMRKMAENGVLLKVLKWRSGAIRYDGNCVKFEKLENNFNHSQKNNN